MTDFRRRHPVLGRARVDRTGQIRAGPGRDRGGSFERTRIAIASSVATDPLATHERRRSTTSPRTRTTRGAVSTTGSSRSRTSAARRSSASIRGSLRIGAVALVGVLMIPLALGAARGRRRRRCARETPADVGVDRRARRCSADPVDNGASTVPITAAATRPAPQRRRRRPTAPSAPTAQPRHRRWPSPQPEEPACAGTYTVIANDFWNRFPKIVRGHRARSGCTPTTPPPTRRSTSATSCASRAGARRRPRRPRRPHARRPRPQPPTTHAPRHRRRRRRRPPLRSSRRRRRRPPHPPPDRRHHRTDGRRPGDPAERRGDHPRGLAGRARGAGARRSPGARAACIPTPTTGAATACSRSTSRWAATSCQASASRRRSSCSTPGRTSRRRTRCTPSPAGSPWAQTDPADRGAAQAGSVQRVPPSRLAARTHRARSSMDRASDYGSEGWGFDSLRAR